MAKDNRIEKALGEFVGLIQFFLKAENSGELSDFETELDSLLDDLEVVQPETYQREQFKSYLMLKKI